MKWSYEEWTVVPDVYLHFNVGTGTYLVSQTKSIFVIIYKISQLLLFPFVMHEPSRSMYLCNISLSVMYFLSSLSSSQGYWAVLQVFSSSFFKVFINLLNQLQTLFADSKWYIQLRFCCSTPCLFCNSLMTSSQQCQAIHLDQRSPFLSAICHFEYGSVSYEFLFHSEGLLLFGI